MIELSYENHFHQLNEDVKNCIKNGILLEDISVENFNRSLITQKINLV